MTENISINCEVTHHEAHDAHTIVSTAWLHNGNKDENTRDSGICSQPRRDITYSSSDNEDNTTSDDSGGDSSEWSQSNEVQSTISPSMDHCSLSDSSPINTTEKPLSNFEGCIDNDWPIGWGGELQVLQLHLMCGGEFCANMKTIDLSTPAHVRLDSSEVLRLLGNKIMNNKSAIEQVGKFVLPNVKEITSGDMVKVMIEKFCRALCGKGTTIVWIREIIIQCDEVSSKFVPGNLRWIETFRSCNKLNVITVSCV